MAFFGAPPPLFQGAYGLPAFDAPPIYGKTSYKYITADGGPPSMGAPPQKPAGPPGPPCWSAGPPQPPQFPGWGAQCSPFSAMPPPPSYWNMPPAPQFPPVFAAPPPPGPPAFVSVYL